MNQIFASYLIGLREGLEGTLIVSILVAYLAKSGRRDRMRYVWLGVGAALLLSIGFGAALTYADVIVGDNKELFEAITSVVAVAFVTSMIFWMRATSRRLKGELTGKLAEALKVGAFAVGLMAFLTVAREGLETALFFFAAARGAADHSGPLIGISTGIATAVVLGWLMYRAIRINLGVFFKWTGLLLVLVAAGIFKYGIHDFQEAGVLPGLGVHAFDISSWYDPGSWYAALLSGMFNLTAQPTVVETVAWATYAGVVLFLFLRPARSSAARPSQAASPAKPATSTPA